MRIKLIILFLSYLSIANCQELPIFNEYHLNKSLINPAIIGSEPCTWLKGTDRHQWIGIEGAPSIQTISFETSQYNKKAIRETDKKIHGFGGFLYRDKNGAYQTLGGQISYAYHFYLSRAEDLKIGMGLTFRLFQASLNESDLHGDYDPIITGSITSALVPDAGAGVFIYNEKFFTGLSFAQLIYSPSSALFGSFESQRNYFLMGGLLSGDTKSNVRVLPSVVLKFREDLKMQFDLNAKILIGEIWWTGISLRHNMDKLPGKPVAILPMIGINFENLGLAYAMELTPSKIMGYNYGTHEFTLSYRFCRDTYRCPVYR
jgi:type IX secretion system PorP/SprF family membrane protein